MILFVLVFSSFSLKPLFLLSGFNGSPLYVTVNGDQFPLEFRGICPDGIQNYQFYPSEDKDFYMTYDRCQAYFMRSYLDSSTKQISNMPGLEVHSSEFGNTSYLLNFDRFIEKAKEFGYVEKKDLFGIGYNFMMYPYACDDTYAQIKENAERVKQETGQKVVFISHSQGTHLVSYFLSNYSDPNWVKEYVDSTIFVAPAFAGNGNYMRLIELEYGQFITNSDMQEAIKQMPGQLIALPNHHAWGNKSVVYNFPTYGQDINASKVADFLYQIDRLDESSQAIFSRVEEEFLKKPIPEPPVKSYVLYNSGISTGVAYNVDRYTKEVTVVMGAGDGDISPDGALFACNNWKDVTCHDWAMNKASYNHNNMLKVDASIQQIFEFIDPELHPDSEDPSDEDDEKPYHGLNAIYFGIPIVGGLQVAIIVLAFLFLLRKKETPSAAPPSEERVSTLQTSVL